jgi:ATP-binding cassette subfamily A (ABC1) protein 3
MSILSQLGFCPQFSALWPNASTVETLHLFATLKGFQGDEIDRRVEYFLNQMKIAQYRDLWAEKLSGGVYSWTIRQMFYIYI